MAEINELRRLNKDEIAVLIAGLKLLELQGEKTTKWVAGVMLEDDAAFVRSFFWAKS